MKQALTFLCAVLLAFPAAAQTRKKTSETATPQKSSTTKSKTRSSEDISPEEDTKKSTTPTKPSGTTNSKKPVKGQSSGTKSDATASKPGTPGDTNTADPEKSRSSKAKKTGEAAASAKKPGSPEAATKKGEVEPKTGKRGIGQDSATNSKSDPAAGSEKTNPPSQPPQDNAGDDPAAAKRPTGPNVSLKPEDLAEFDGQTEPVQKLIRNGLALTERDLTYRYGSSDPNSGGMDCSGTIYYLLKQSGIKEPPRDSSGLYLWAEKAGTLRSVSVKDLEDRALADLKPGDLLFWEGTYEVQRDPPISHTMIYLGREKKSGTRVMVGASDGRTYAGISRNGVSVFDFRLPRAESSSKFVGYARVPGFDHSIRRNSAVNP